jgi:hypothetical protein
VKSGEAAVGGARIFGSSLEAGVVWRPADYNFRAGATVGFPVAGEQIESSCDPGDCEGFILPRRIHVPAELGIGGAWRLFSPKPWNVPPSNAWRDDRALLVVADLLVTGAVDDGHGIEAFLDKQLQPSGRSAVFSVRAGVEYEWFPARLRLRAGSYWEPGRMEGSSGRLHGTGGVEWGFWDFCLWGDRYRLRTTLTGDFAARYGNLALGVGLWH